MTTTAETPVNTSIPNELWEMGRSTLETVVWAQDQMDSVARAWLDQARVSRHDAQRVTETLMSQAKANHEELQNLVEKGVREALTWVPGWGMGMGNNR